MLNLNWIEQGTCYETKEWRNWILFHTTSSSYHIFNSADRIRLAEEIIQRHRQDNPQDLYQELNLEPDLLGTIKIITAIENYFKAVILDNDYIIHKVNDKDKALKKRQKKDPIHITEISHFEKQVIPNEGTFIVALDNMTINFSDIINSESYLRLLNPKQEIIETLKDLNKKRNNLHYLTTLSSVFSHHDNLRYKTLKDTINFEIIELNEQIGRQMKISEKAYLRNRL